MLLTSPATDCPGAASEPGQGWGPGRTVSPPRCPGLRSASVSHDSADASPMPARSQLPPATSGGLGVRLGKWLVMADSGDSVTKVPQIGDENPEAVAGMRVLRLRWFSSLWR